MKRIYLFIILIGFWSTLKAQDVKVTATAPNVVETGEQFQLNISVNAQPSDFNAPSMPEFNVAGPYTQSSSNIQMINGKVSQSVTYSYIYSLQANKPGKFTIGAAEATVNGKKYRSNPVTVEVVAGAANNNSQSNSQNQSNSQAQSSNENVNASGDLFIRVLLDKSSVYQGEYVTATIKIFISNKISGVTPGSFNPAFNDFFTQNVDIPQPRAIKENVNGKVYSTAILGKYILFPQRSGVIRIDPMEMDCSYQQQTQQRSRGMFDDFFGPMVQEYQTKLKTLPVTLNVKPLPANKPESFHGAVGRFSFDANIDKTDVKTNDAITLKLTLTGTGNIKLIEPPKVNFPPDFDTYDPKININTSKASGDITGTKTFEYLIIPRNAGKFRIAPIPFSYFDLASNQYKTVSSDEFTINVEKGPQNDNTAVVSGLSREDVKFIGKDIRFIKEMPFVITRINSYFFGSLPFFAIFVLGLLVFLFLVILRRRIIKQNANVALMRNKKADKFAIRRLKSAKAHLDKNETELFYEELLKAIWGYLSDKLNIPVSNLSRETAKEQLEKKNIPEDLLQNFYHIVENCEYARYAPASVNNAMKEDYETTIGFITKLQQKLR